MRPAKETPHELPKSFPDARAPFYLTTHLLTYGHLFLFFRTNVDTQLQLQAATGTQLIIHARGGGGRGEKRPT